MNKITFGFAVVLCLAVGQALECYKCGLGFGSVCLTTTTTCSAGQQCYIGAGTAANVLNYIKKGCLDVSKCNQTEEVNFPGKSNSSLYTIMKTCCSTDLCNGALGHFHFSVVSMAFTTIISVFMVKILI